MGWKGLFRIIWHYENNVVKGVKIKKEISMKITANMLGLGNAATPLGLKAMNSMQKENNKEKWDN